MTTQQTARRLWLGQLADWVGEWIAEDEEKELVVDLRSGHLQRFGVITFRSDDGRVHMSTHISNEPDLGPDWQLVYVADLDRGLQVFPALAD